MMTVENEVWDEVFDHLVIDDLREFDPPLNVAQGEVVYFRTLEEALHLLNELKVYIKTLWLDFDLGYDQFGRPSDIKPFIHGLVGASLADAPDKYKWKIDNIFIITANPVGRDWMKPYLEKYLGPSAGNTNIVCLDPISQNLVNKTEWSTDA